MPKSYEVGRNAIKEKKEKQKAGAKKTSGSGGRNTHHAAAQMTVNGANWAKRMEIPTDEDFWDKWNALDDQLKLVEAPAPEGKRCVLCKRRISFLAKSSAGGVVCDGASQRPGIPGIWGVPKAFINESSYATFV